MAIDRRRAHWRPCRASARGSLPYRHRATDPIAVSRPALARPFPPPRAPRARGAFGKSAARFWWENPHARASSRRRLLASSVRVRGISSPRRHRRIAAERPARGAFRDSCRGARAPLDARVAQQISIALPAILVLVAARATSARLARDPHGAADPLRFRGRIQRRHRRGRCLPNPPRPPRSSPRPRPAPPRATPHRQRPPNGRRGVRRDARRAPAPAHPAHSHGGGGGGGPQPAHSMRTPSSPRAPMGPRHGLHQHRRPPGVAATPTPRAGDSCAPRCPLWERVPPVDSTAGATPSRRARRRRKPRGALLRGRGSAKRLKGRSRARTARRAWRRRDPLGSVPPARRGGPAPVDPAAPVPVMRVDRGHRRRVRRSGSDTSVRTRVGSPFAMGAEPGEAAGEFGVRPPTNSASNSTPNSAGTPPRSPAANRGISERRRCSPRPRRYKRARRRSSGSCDFEPPAERAYATRFGRGVRGRV